MLKARFAVRSLIFLLVLLVTPKLASGEDTNCSITVEGFTYHQGKCELEHTATGSTYIRSVDDSNAIGYWVQLNHINDTSSIAHWNQEYGATHAHSTLGKVEYTENCWENDQARICVGLPSADIPFYRIEPKYKNAKLSRLIAVVNRIEYVLTHPRWDGASPATLGPSRDFDGDGKTEQIIYVEGHKSESRKYMSLVSYRGGGLFSFLDDDPIDITGADIELISAGDQAHVRVLEPSVSRRSIWEIRDYVVHSGGIVLRASYKAHSNPLVIKRFSARDFNEAGESDRMYFDFNHDGEDDFLKCRRKSGAQKLQCESCFFEGPCLALPKCENIRISRRVSEGTQVLICDGEAMFLSSAPMSEP